MATGPGSADAKKKFLQLFLREGIKSAGFTELAVSFGVDKGNKVVVVWKPLKAMTDHYGLAEFMRRIKNGSIIARKDGDEWEFRHATSKEYTDTRIRADMQAKTQTKSEKATLENLVKDVPELSEFFGMEKEKDEEDLIQFLQQSTNKKKQLTNSAVGSSADPAPGPDGRRGVLADAEEKLSALTAGAKHKPLDLCKKAVAALKRIEKKGQLSENEVIVLRHHISALEGCMNKKNQTVEGVKSTLCKAMQALKGFNRSE